MTKMCEQKQDICRAVTFYNDYIPVSGEGSKVEFCAFGNVDGIQVGEALTRDESGQSVTELIWEAQKKFYRELEGNSSVQRIYIVRSDEKKEEQEFWDGNELPFFFFCRIQCSGEKALLMQDRSSLEENTLFGGSGIKIKTYLTYDNTDLFIVIRASEYVKGAEALNRLHQNGNLISQNGHISVLKNSFTVMAVRNKWIRQMNDEQKQKWNRSKIDRVYIRLIEREGGDIRKIENMIPVESKIRRTVLGTDDQMIVLSDVGWGDFLALYDEDNGIFGKRSEGSDYNKNAAGVTSQICVKLNQEADEKNSTQDSAVEKTESDTELFKLQTERLKRKLKEIAGDCFDNVNELYIILNVMPKYSGEMFNDYVFFPLLKILDTLIALMARQKKLLCIIDKEPFYDFLAGFCFYTQNTMLTDRHTAQMLGFNVKIYDIPVKLNAFYNAYMYRITSILNMPEEKNEQQKIEQIDYDFIVLPGMEDTVNVKELYKGVSDNLRLIKVEIPEYSFYNVRSMMIILAHETAHYVGRGLRSRDYRTEAVISSYAHVFIRYVEVHCCLKEMKAEKWKECEKRLINLLYRRLLQEIDGDFLIGRRYNEKQADPYWGYRAQGADDAESDFRKKLCEKINANIDYFTELKPEIHMVMREIIERDLTTVFAPVLLEKDCLPKVSCTIRQAAARYIATTKETTVVASERVLDELMALYEESFADLMSILILKVGVEEYITGIVDCAERQNMNFELLIHSEAVLRIAAVLVCILESGAIKQNGINMRDEWYRRLDECKEDKKWEKITKQAMKLWYSGGKVYENKSYDDNVYHALIYDEVILANAAKYLLRCMEQFEKNYNSVFEDKIMNIRMLFQIFSEREENSGEKQIIEMLHFIDDYKSDMRKKLSIKGNGDGKFE